MHERSLVKALIEQVCEESRNRTLGRIHEIQLQIGEFSGVEPRLVESAFEEMSSGYWDSEVRLHVEVVPLTAKCRACDETFFVQSFCFICPKCESVHVNVIAGEEMRLVSVSAERRELIR
jgi:hydrogenase nickel incorporation protein HypA/HybF